MATRHGPPHVERCPQCGFRFRPRAEHYQHLSPLGRKLQWSGYLAMIPMFLLVAAFMAFMRDDRGIPDFAGRDNLIALVMFLPSIALFVASLVVPKHATYRCPQCSWKRTLRSGDVVEPAKSDELQAHSGITNRPADKGPT
jgi:DNA-directed RNA polymerase subunit RPC12/RpoP